MIHSVVALAEVDARDSKISVLGPADVSINIIFAIVALGALWPATANSSGSMRFQFLAFFIVLLA